MKLDVERQIYLALCRAGVGAVHADQAAMTAQAVLDFLKSMECVHDWKIELRDGKVCVKYTQLYVLSWYGAEWPIEDLVPENAVVSDVMDS